MSLVAPRRIVLAALVLALVTAVAVVPAGAAAGDADWFRVQFSDTITGADRAALAATGARSLQYVPRDAYLAYGSSAARSAARQLDSVTAVAEVPLRDRIDAQLLGRSGSLGLQVLGHPGALDANALAGLGRIVSRYDIGAGSPLGGVDLLADAAVVNRVAELPGVLYVGPRSSGLQAEDEGSGQVLAGAVTGTNPPAPGYEQFLASKGLDGSGVTISIVDDGIDATHPEFSGRVVKRYNYGGENAVMPAEGHGTHVAGIAGGMGANIPGIGRVKDSRGLLYGLGVAPGIKFVDQPAIQLGAGFPPGGFPQMSRDAISSGAVAWNASWTDGGGEGVGYVANAAVMDGIVRDGDQSAAGSQPFSLVFSAGNSGGPEKKITSPKEAKNIISVASSLGHRAGNVDTISTFSSRGPAVDGRIVPTVTAPGQTIVSARAATGALCTVPLSGAADAPPADGYSLYTGCSGTSMASPQVAGAVALIHQWWRRANAGDEPSPAMVKALLVNSAQDIRRSDIPNKEEGWGRVNLANLFDATAQRLLLDESTVLSAVGQQQTLAVEPVDASRPMKVSLVWTDAPGAPKAAPALVNDLDLTVTGADGTAWAGNTFVGGKSRPGGGPDRLNNVENVYLDAPSGAYSINVAAANLPGDGVPGNATPTDQDFALVVTNGRMVP